MMFLRFTDQDHPFPELIIQGEGDFAVETSTAPDADAQEAMRMTLLTPIVYGNDWAAVECSMSPDEARAMARELMAAAEEWESRHGA